MADPMRWRRRTVAVVAALALVALAGCGVPSSGPPVALGTVPAGMNAGDQNPNADLPAPDSYKPNEKREFIDGYLKAAVDAAAQSDDPKGPFAVQASFLGANVPKPKYVGKNPQITLYSVIAGPEPQAKPDPAATDPDAVTYSLGAVKVGTFEPSSGIVTPDASSGPVTLKFTVAWTRPNADVPGGLRIVASSLADGSLIATDAWMKTAFQPHYIYWWNKALNGLIPDLRYISGQSPVRAASAIANWVLGNPPSWMFSAVERVVPSATMADTFVGVASGPDRFTVNLTSSAAGSTQMALLATQLRMSIGKIQPNGPGPVPVPVEVLVGGQTQVTDETSDWRNRAQNFTSAQTDAKAYAIVDGKVRPIDMPNGTLYAAKDAELPAALATPANANAIWAAVDRAQGNAAIVQKGTDGKQALKIVRTGASTPVSALADHRSFIRPQWIGKTLLAGADGQLYTISATNRVTPVAGAENVTAFAVAPDGERIAFVSGGKLYLAILDLTTAADPQLTPPIQINVRGSLDHVTAVSWGPSDTSLLVGGVSGLAVMDLYGLNAVNAFGANDEAVPQPVEALASVPYDLFGAPPDAGQMGPMMEAGSRLYTITAGGPVANIQAKGITAPFFGG